MNLVSLNKFVFKKTNIYKLTLLLLIFFSSTSIFSQSITVDDSSYSPQELMETLLSDNCTPISNVSISSNQSVAYFDGNNSEFPLSKGVLLRNGIAKYTEGAFTDNNLSSQINTNGDTNLQSISDNEGQVADITDVAFFEFEFTALSNIFNFNYVFASNEYGEWQCGFSDIFAILLTNKDTGETTNIAVLPNTNTNISVKNIRNQLYNSNCTSNYPELFEVYNTNETTNSTLNMRGHTVALNASASVIPNTPYKIKFVIGDYNDSNYDSAVFIEAQSVNSSINLGDDIVTCQGNDIEIDTHLDNNLNFTYEWYFNNTLIADENNSLITVSDFGVYKVVVSGVDSDCILTDEVTISNINAEEPNDIHSCNSSNYDLTENSVSTLEIDSQQYELFYYNSLDNITNNIPIPTAQTSNYFSDGYETIYIKIKNIDTHDFCDTILEFELLPYVFEPTVPEDIEACVSGSVNIPNNVQSDILDGLSPSHYTVSYFLSEEDATNNENPISNPNSFTHPDATSIITESVTITACARVERLSESDCFEVVNFNIIFNPAPPIDKLQDVYVCTEYELLPLTYGTYYTGPNGTGNQLNPGDIINTNSTIFIYNGDGDTCYNQSLFYVRIVNNYSIRDSYCNKYVVPNHATSNFYTAPNGPNGNGELLPTGTVLTESQVIYLFGQDSNGNFCTDKELEINITPLPPIDRPEDVFACNSYVLPELTNGKYSSGINGIGVQYSPGDTITYSKDIYISNRSNNCVSNHILKIQIIKLDDFEDIEACGSYTLPNLPFGNYYTESEGNGESIPQGTEITSTQKIYYFASEITTTPNCTSDFSFNAQINPLPEVDSLDNITACINNLPTLPALNNGKYFTQSNGNGIQLFEGDTIDRNQKIYIYNTNQFCESQTSFLVNIKDLPPVDNFTDIFSCNAYTLPNLTHGKYYTESGAQGQELQAGDAIEASQKMYIYNEYDNVSGCNNESVFEINILGVQVDELDDTSACESYTLPNLESGNYFTQSNGQGTQLNAGDVITSSQTLYIYKENGTRFFCFDQDEFTITIANKPAPQIIEDMVSCGSASLSNLSTDILTIEYYKDFELTRKIETSDYEITDIGSQYIFIKAYPAGFSGCYTKSRFLVTVHPLLDLNVQGGVICVDAKTGETTNPFLIETYLSADEFKVEWYLDNQLVGTGVNHSATKAGEYTVKTIKLTPDEVPNCNYKETQVLIQESKPEFKINYLSKDFSHNYSVEVVTVKAGLGSYKYSLDGISFQSSPFFYDLKPGHYTVTIKDVSGICGLYTLDFLALSYPKFFTPNSDGINDTWNIKELKNNTEAKIKIFDRFGKTVTIIKPTGKGWSGLNKSGNKMSSSDYWFIVEYTLNGIKKQYKSHFSLLRKDNS